jgi:two-component system, OmpR family, phosphate regulon sensor histidine kinase PhoR
VEPWSIVSLALGVALAGAVLVALRRDRAVRAARARSRHGDRAEADATRRIAAAREDEASLRETLASGVLRVDAGLRVVEASPRAHELLDHRPGTLVGRTVMEVFLDPGIESVVRSALQRGSAGGELRRPDVDGAALVVRARRVPAGGAAWVVIDDVSELHRLRRIRAEFIDNLSHELRTPLTTVSLLAETLERDAEEAGDAIPGRMRDRIGKIEVETGHLVQMVTELLDLSRIESGGTLDLADDVDLADLAARSAERLRSFAERQGVSLAVDVPGPVPRVRADPARLGQVVVNLVHNAVKFSPDGGDVRVDVRADGSSVVVSVEDHGIGIPSAARERVFERFYKVDRARLRAGVGGGTGLGLAIARHVVDQHGGRIWVESTEGAGSTFRVAIPVASSADGADGAA